MQTDIERDIAQLEDQVECLTRLGDILNYIEDGGKITESLMEMVDGEGYLSEVINSNFSPGNEKGVSKSIRSMMNVLTDASSEFRDGNFVSLEEIGENLKELIELLNSAPAKYVFSEGGPENRVRGSLIAGYVLPFIEDRLKVLRGDFMTVNRYNEAEDDVFKTGSLKKEEDFIPFESFRDYFRESVRGLQQIASDIRNDFTGAVVNDYTRLMENLGYSQNGNVWEREENPLDKSEGTLEDLQWTQERISEMVSAAVDTADNIRDIRRKTENSDLVMDDLLSGVKSDIKRDHARISDKSSSKKKEGSNKIRELRNETSVTGKSVRKIFDNYISCVRELRIIVNTVADIQNDED